MEVHTDLIESYNYVCCFKYHLCSNSINNCLAPKCRLVLNGPKEFSDLANKRNSLTNVDSEFN